MCAGDPYKTRQVAFQTEFEVIQIGLVSSPRIQEEKHSWDTPRVKKIKQGIERWQLSNTVSCSKGVSMLPPPH